MAIPSRGAAVAGPRGRWCVVLLGTLLACSCARGADLDAQNKARRALEAAAEPVLMSVVGNPFDMDEARLNALVSHELAEGVSGLSTRFTTSAERAAAPDPRVVVVLNPVAEPAPETLCVAPDTIVTGPAAERVRIVAAFCQGDEALSLARTEDAAAGPTDQRFLRLLWRTAKTLFPDDYDQTYGFGILPRWIDFGIGGGFGK